jgi:regulator of protease activity HflC (stomatin/prohibitin superfamily)
MRRVAMVGLLFLLILGMTGCSTRVGPGNVGIKIKLSGDNRGIDKMPLLVGRVYYNPFSEDVRIFPTYIKTAVWSDNANEGKYEKEAITFTNKDQLAFSADISIAIQLDSSFVPVFYTKFPHSDLDEFTHGFMRNLARQKFDDAAGKFSVDQIMGDNSNFIKEARSTLQSEVEAMGVKIVQFGFVGAPRPPQAVIDAINAKVQAMQDAIQAENRIAQSEALAKQAIKKAEGEARANQLLTASLSPQLLEWRRLDIQEKALAKWNGSLPTTMIPGQTMPFIGTR